MIMTYGESAIGTAAVAASEIAYDMAPRRAYRLTAKGALWFRIVIPGEATGVAAPATAGSHYLPAGGIADIAPIASRTRVSIIRDAGADVTAILSEIPNVVSL